jgi:hypothetical protein
MGRDRPDHVGGDSGVWETASDLAAVHWPS